VLPEYLGQHVLLSAAVMALGLPFSLPLTIAAARNPRVRWPVGARLPAFAAGAHAVLDAARDPQRRHGNPRSRAGFDRSGTRCRHDGLFQSTFLYEAVATREVDVITAFSSDGRIAANDLVVLEDPRDAILSYDAIVLLAAKHADDPLLHRALEPLVGAIPVDLMRTASQRVDRKENPEAPITAARWLGARAAGASD
jgi:hypothetical protein